MNEMQVSKAVMAYTKVGLLAQAALKVGASPKACQHAFLDLIANPG